MKRGEKLSVFLVVLFASILIGVIFFQIRSVHAETSSIPKVIIPGKGDAYTRYELQTPTGKWIWQDSKEGQALLESNPATPGRKAYYSIIGVTFYRSGDQTVGLYKFRDSDNHANTFSLKSADLLKKNGYAFDMGGYSQDVEDAYKAGKVKFAPQGVSQDFQKALKEQPNLKDAGFAEIKETTGRQTDFAQATDQSAFEKAKAAAKKVDTITNPDGTITRIYRADPTDPNNPFEVGVPIAMEKEYPKGGRVDKFIPANPDAPPVKQLGYNYKIETKDGEMDKKTGKILKEPTATLSIIDPTTKQPIQITDPKTGEPVLEIKYSSKAEAEKAAKEMQSSLDKGITPPILKSPVTVKVENIPQLYNPSKPGEPGYDEKSLPPALQFTEPSSNPELYANGRPLDSLLAKGWQVYPTPTVEATTDGTLRTIIGDPLKSGDKLTGRELLVSPDGKVYHLNTFDPKNPKTEFELSGKVVVLSPTSAPSTPVAPSPAPEKEKTPTTPVPSEGGILPSWVPFSKTINGWLGNKSPDSAEDKTLIQEGELNRTGEIATGDASYTDKYGNMYWYDPKTELLTELTHGGLDSNTYYFDAEGNLKLMAGTERSDTDTTPADKSILPKFNNIKQEYIDRDYAKQVALEDIIHQRADEGNPVPLTPVAPTPTPEKTTPVPSPAPAPSTEKPVIPTPAPVQPAQPSAQTAAEKQAAEEAAKAEEAAMQYENDMYEKAKAEDQAAAAQPATPTPEKTTPAPLTPVAPSPAPEKETPKTETNPEPEAPTVPWVAPGKPQTDQEGTGEGPSTPEKTTPAPDLSWYEKLNPIPYLKSWWNGDSKPSTPVAPTPAPTAEEIPAGTAPISLEEFKKTISPAREVPYPDGKTVYYDTYNNLLAVKDKLGRYYVPISQKPVEKSEPAPSTPVAPSPAPAEKPVIPAPAPSTEKPVIPTPAPVQPAQPSAQTAAEKQAAEEAAKAEEAAMQYENDMYEKAKAEDQAAAAQPATPTPPKVVQQPTTIPAPTPAPAEKPVNPTPAPSTPVAPSPAPEKETPKPAPQTTQYSRSLDGSVPIVEETDSKGNHHQYYFNQDDDSWHEQMQEDRDPSNDPVIPPKSTLDLRLTQTSAAEEGKLTFAGRSTSPVGQALPSTAENPPSSDNWWWNSALDLFDSLINPTPAPSTPVAPTQSPEKTTPSSSPKPAAQVGSDGLTSIGNGQKFRKQIPNFFKSSTDTNDLGQRVTTYKDKNDNTVGTYNLKTGEVRLPAANINKPSDGTFSDVSSKDWENDIKSKIDPTKTEDKTVPNENGIGSHTERMFYDKDGNPLGKYNFARPDKSYEKFTPSATPKTTTPTTQPSTTPASPSAFIKEGEDCTDSKYCISGYCNSEGVCAKKPTNIGVTDTIKSDKSKVAGTGKVIFGYGR